MSTVKYCRPDGVPLAMDLYLPPAAALAGRPAAVAMYLHGGGALGDRKMHGAGASLANHQGALFTPLQQQLNARGFVVAAIDHALLLGLTGPGAGFDQGQYLDQSSAVQAVVDMFGPADLTNFSDSAPFGRFIAQISIGGSAAVRCSASAITYVAPGAPPFLILQGTEDTMVRPRQSAELAQRLRTAGVPTTLIEVQGTGHSLDTPGERPSPDELTTTIIDFFVATLK